MAQTSATSFRSFTRLFLPPLVFYVYAKQEGGRFFPPPSAAGVDEFQYVAQSGHRAESSEAALHYRSVCLRETTPPKTPMWPEAGVRSRRGSRSAGTRRNTSTLGESRPYEALAVARSHRNAGPPSGRTCRLSNKLSSRTPPVTRSGPSRILRGRSLERGPAKR